MMSLEETHPEAAGRLAAVWAAGNLAAFPTETVYGVGAGAGRPEGLARLRALKGRAGGQPFQLLVAGAEMAERYARSWTAAARRLAERCWPGPLTLILPACPEVAAPDGTVGLRVPDQPLLLEALRLYGGGVWAASANPPGRPPLEGIEDIRAWAGDALALALQGTRPPAGQASTVARLEDDGRITVLRAGAWSCAQLRRLAFG